MFSLRVLASKWVHLRRHMVNCLCCAERYIYLGLSLHVDNNRNLDIIVIWILMAAKRATQALCCALFIVLYCIGVPKNM